MSQNDEISFASAREFIEAQHAFSYDTSQPVVTRFAALVESQRTILKQTIALWHRLEKVPEIKRRLDYDKILVAVEHFCTEPRHQYPEEAMTEEQLLDHMSQLWWGIHNLDAEIAAEINRALG